MTTTKIAPLVMTTIEPPPAGAFTVHLVAVGDPPSPTLLAGWEMLGVRPLAVAAPDPGTNAPCLLFAPPVRGFVRAGLTQPFHGFIELGEGSEALSPGCVAAIRQGGLALSLTTRVASELDLAKVLVAAVGDRFGIASHILGRLELVLAEAISNAIIHGNLGISSQDRATLEGVQAFQAVMAERLADPALAARRVELAVLKKGAMLTLTLSDHGDGYDLSRELARMPSGSDKFGRGLALIRWLSHSVAADDGGRTLVVTFDLG